jgi:hypothetical protein
MIHKGRAAWDANRPVSLAFIILRIPVKSLGREISGLVCDLSVGVFTYYLSFSTSLVVKLRSMLEVLDSPFTLSTPSPFKNLVPVNSQVAHSHRYSEFIAWESSIYQLWESTVDRKAPSLLWRGEQDQILKHIIAEYDWNHCFHPLDVGNWQTIFQTFDWGDFFLSEVFDFPLQSMRKQWEEIKSLTQEERDLVRLRKIDPRLFNFIKNHGFKMNSFFLWCFARLKLSYNSQMEVVDQFSKFFRREGILPKDYLEQNLNILEEKVNSRREFLIFMTHETSPRFTHFKKKRDALRQALSLPATICTSFDDLLEEDWVEMKIRVESLDELSTVADALNDGKNRSIFSELFGEK